MNYIKEVKEFVFGIIIKGCNAKGLQPFSVNLPPRREVIKLLKIVLIIILLMLCYVKAS
ncbi:hypothetical protein cco1_08609 [Campylobacter coli 111-3]|nr:hypothetical protein cco1_08609 [Campylobacter coli 111-3]